MCTVRGFLQKKDGSIHTDSKTKIITVLLYLNEGWDNDGGRLRLLRNGTDLEDYVAEVPPTDGTLLANSPAPRTFRGSAAVVVLRLTRGAGAGPFSGWFLVYVVLGRQRR